MEFWSLLIEIVILLAACLALGAICSLLKQSPLVGYLIAGMFLGGPGGIGVIQSDHHIETISELGVALLLFSLGLEFSWERVRALGARALSGGALQVVVTSAVAVGLAMLFGIGWVPAIAVGSMVSLSSTAAVLRVLVEQGELDSVPGRNSLAVLLVQDMAVVPLAILMALLAKGGTAEEVAMHLGQTLWLAAGLILLLYLLLNFVAVRILQLLSAEQNRELAVLMAAVVGLGATWAAHHVGLSPALGAFVAGMFLGSSAFATQIRADISALRMVLLTLFFGAVGMVANPGWILANAGEVVGVAVLVVAVKSAVVWLIFRSLGYSDRTAIATGLCLAQVGEFAFVLSTAGKEGGVISEDLHAIVISSSMATLLITPFLVRWAPAIGEWGESRLPNSRGRIVEEETGENEQPEVLIVGFGPAGQAVGKSVAHLAEKVLVIDLNLEAREIAESLGLRFQIGDASQSEVMEHAHLGHVRWVVITLPARAAALAVLSLLRTLAPTAHVVVRSRYERHESDFAAAGANAVIGDEAEVGRQLSEHLRQQLEGTKENRPADGGGK